MLSVCTEDVPEEKSDRKLLLCLWRVLKADGFLRCFLPVSSCSEWLVQIFHVETCWSFMLSFSYMKASWVLQLPVSFMKSVCSECLHWISSSFWTLLKLLLNFLLFLFGSLWRAAGLTEIGSSWCFITWSALLVMLPVVTTRGSQLCSFQVDFSPCSKMIEAL